MGCTANRTKCKTHSPSICIAQLQAVLSLNLPRGLPPCTAVTWVLASHLLLLLLLLLLVAVVEPLVSIYVHLALLRVIKRCSTLCVCRGHVGPPSLKQELHTLEVTRLRRSYQHGPLLACLP